MPDRPSSSEASSKEPLDADVTRPSRVLAPGERLGAFRLIEEVGYGGMGSVWIARREGPGGFSKFLAIKTIHPHLAREPAFVAMFLDEARIAATMEHPNVAQVFELGDDDGHLFLAMEYLHGEHLGQVRHSAGAMDPAVAAHVVAEAARGLHHAHEAVGEDGKPLHLVHRDVSPQNVFVTYDGVVKVTDFGIARAEGRLAQKTKTGHIKGKCAYMSPEQVFAKPLDRRTDVFALGAILWELLAGRPLFDFPSDTEVLMAIANDPIGPPEDCDVGLAAVLMRALARDPDERYATALLMARELEEFIARAGANAREGLRQQMATLFGAERARKDAWLRATPSAPTPTPEPPATPEAFEPTLAAEPTPAPPAAEALPTAQAEAAPPARRWLPAALVVLLAAGAAAFALYPGAPPDVPENMDTAADPDSDPNPDPDPDPDPDLDTDSDWETDTDPDTDSDSETDTDPETDSETDGETETDPAATTPRMRPRMTAPPAMTSTPAAMTSTPPVPAPAPAKLSVLTIPWGTVSINGGPPRRSPFYDEEVPSGTLRLVFRPEGTGDPQSQVLRLRPGQRGRATFR